MTTLAHTPVEDPDQLALIADDMTPLGQDHYELFLAACRAEADAHAGWVNPNRVRARLMTNGELQIDPRAYSAMWSRATGKSGPMVTHRTYLVPIVGKGSKGNGNKAVPMRKWVTTDSTGPSVARGEGAPQQAPSDRPECSVSPVAPLGGHSP